MNPEKFKKIKTFVARKRIIIPTVLVVIILFFSFSGKGDADKISVIPVTVGDLSQTVQATGQVTSNTDLALSFNGSGVVRSLKVEVGNTVKEGQILATLDQGAVVAALTQARGVLAAAQARLKRTLEGNSNEEIALAQVNFDRAKSTQETIVRNAYTKLLNSTPEAVPEREANDLVAPVITGTYAGDKQGVINLHVYPSTGGTGFTASGLAVGNGVSNAITAQPIGTSGLYVSFPSGDNFKFTDWVIAIPNKKAPDYLANYNAYQAALSESHSIIDQKAAELALKKAQARGSDVDLAEADVLGAQGQVQAAQARYEDTIIRAPRNGTITKVNVKYGELTDPQKQAIVLQDVDHLYIEADINESNIATVALGQTVSITFDAFSKDKKFTGTVSHIDPSSVTTEGIVNYKIKVSINEADPNIRPGMNAEITIAALTKHAVVSVPKAAVLVKDGISTVNIITNESKKTYTSRTVTTGILGDGNRIEITNGLALGESIAVIATQ